MYWRRRLAKSQRPHRINDAVRRVIEETAVLKGRQRRAVDSTILADAQFARDLAKYGITPMTGYTPEKTRALQEQQIKEWGEAVKRMGITAAE